MQICKTHAIAADNTAKSNTLTEKKVHITFSDMHCNYGLFINFTAQTQKYVDGVTKAPIRYM